MKWGAGAAREKSMGGGGETCVILSTRKNLSFVFFKKVLSLREYLGKKGWVQHLPPTLKIRSVSHPNLKFCNNSYFDLILNHFLYLKRQWRNSLYLWEWVLHGPSHLSFWRITGLLCALFPHGKGAHCTGNMQFHWVTLPDFLDFMFPVSKPCSGGHWREDTGMYTTGSSGLMIWVVV